MNVYPTQALDLGFEMVNNPTVVGEFLKDCRVDEIKAPFPHIFYSEGSYSAVVREIYQSDVPVSLDSLRERYVDDHYKWCVDNTNGDWAFQFNVVRYPPNSMKSVSHGQFAGFIFSFKEERDYILFKMFWT